MRITRRLLHFHQAVHLDSAPMKVGSRHMSEHGKAPLLGVLAIEFAKACDKRCMTVCLDLSHVVLWWARPPRSILVSFKVCSVGYFSQVHSPQADVDREFTWCSLLSSSVGANWKATSFGFDMIGESRWAPTFQSGTSPIPTPQISAR